MPLVHGTSRDYFFADIVDLRRRVAAIEAQQNHGATDTSGRLRLRWGLQPDKTFGMWALNPTTGDPVMKLNGSSLELLSSTGVLLIDLTDTGLSVYDATGHELVKLDHTGQSVYDTTGNLRTELGKLSNGDYGLLVADPSTGARTEILPVYEAGVTGSTTSTSMTAFTAGGGPTVTATVGASGKVQITASAHITPPSITGGRTAWGTVGIGIDTAQPTGALAPILRFAQYSGTTNAISLGASCSASIVVTGLSPGKHKFEMMYKSYWGGGSTFTRRLLVVRPL